MTSTTPKQDNKRAQFEEWFDADFGREVGKRCEDGYNDVAANYAWIGWQAARATPQPATAAAPERANYLYLCSQVADLLHLTEFYPNISVGDENQARKTVATLKQILAAPIAQQAAPNVESK